MLRGQRDSEINFTILKNTPLTSNRFHAIIFSFPQRITMYLLRLPLPPSVNNYYGYHSKFGYTKVYIKKPGQEYRTQVLNYVLQNNLQLRANTALSVTILFTPKSKHKQDVDNILKCLLDALTHAEVWQDDSFIFDLHITKQPPSKENAGLILEIAPFSFD